MENRESLEQDIDSPEDVSEDVGRQSGSSGMKGEDRRDLESDLGSEDITPESEEIE